ncbi:MAG: MerR family transcriptional regulator [Bacteroidaceae bacterium]|nr:MerR family transcriptional regulator [Bacteroidaceae bacterium]
MALGKNRDHKLYYSIGEVAAEIGVNESTLRYWETVFKQIAPKKGTNGVRRYTKEDLRMVKLVHHLVKEKGMTLVGAQSYLKGQGKMEETEVNATVIERLRAIRAELVGLRDALGEL